MAAEQKFVIAIDGHSSCGKSTLAKALAKHFSYVYIDSGAMYRAVTLFAIQNNCFRPEGLSEECLLRALDEIDISFDKNKSGIQTILNGNNVEDEIRQIEVSSKVSFVSKVREVRQKLVSLQRKMSKDGGIVMDGRDIGTVVFPQADFKLFMTAKPDVRAQRRFDEMIEKGVKVNYEEILQNVKDRDFLDENREESPLCKAEDAIVLDNSYLSRQEQLDWVINQIEKRMLGHEN
ncbi:MAG: (d)CMP kinase [Marinilabiliales bacterium]|nr:MAG: (d)CMP kinase [Marinilabiliales bacterium]